MNRKLKHIVCCTANLKYDGRVTSLINSIAEAAPSDDVIVFNLNSTEKSFECQYPNVKYKYLGLNVRRKSRVLRYVECFLYFAIVFFRLLLLRPFSIQVHHEGVLLAPLLYKMIFRNVILVYDDKELYHPHDSNIIPVLYYIELAVIRKCNLVIFTNSVRCRAIKLILRGGGINYIIVENYVFACKWRGLNLDATNAIRELHQQGKKVLLHQGVVTEGRGASYVDEIISKAPAGWAICFIGIHESELKVLKNCNSEKVHCLGFIPYLELNSMWSKVDASMMFYNADTFNNKFAAPNRLFLAANNGIPVIGNSDNETLSSFITMHGNGILIPSDPVDDFFDYFQTYSDNSKKMSGKFNYNNYFIQEVVDFYRDTL